VPGKDRVELDEVTSEGQFATADRDIDLGVWP